MAWEPTRWVNEHGDIVSITADGTYMLFFSRVHPDDPGFRAGFTRHEEAKRMCDRLHEKGLAKDEVRDG